ncbi:ABC transporter substrate-binding protein [Mesorhizobium sp. M0019]|uniref:ABC transporter substrate-binding protein n=1 Tax=Mesorhizobium sp. M0019 TaxID=2956845 RepID=UPI003336C066
MNKTDLSNLVVQSKTGSLSRRQFMQGALALGFSVPSATALWSTQVAAATPKKGGTFRAAVGDANTTDTLDPAQAQGAFAIQSPHIWGTYLTEVTPDNKIGPDSAESWEATPDAKSWRFTLARGQEFHNGKSLTSDDVVASLNHHLGPDSKSGAKGLLSDVESIKTDGKGVVVITLKVGTADLPAILADYHIAIMPADASGKVNATSGIGAGPYKLASFQPGVQANFVRHDKYHRESYFDEVQLLGINDVTARMNSLVSGIADVIADPDPKVLDMLKSAPSVVVDEVPSGTQVTIDMDCSAVPFDNVDVRLALKYALDRRAVLEKIALGHGTIGNDQPIAPNILYYAELEQREYDPDKAKFHLKKAGAEGLAVSLSMSDAVYAGAIDIANIYQQSAEKAGIKLDVVNEPTDSYWSNVWGKKPFAGGNYGQRATPDMVFSTFFRQGAAWNNTRWQNDRFQQLLLSAKGELDEKKRAQMYKEMQQLCHDDSGTIVAFFQSFLAARNERVQHQSNVSSEWQLDGGRAYQRWWFEG